ncbi:MAG: hypothetical protein ACFFD2_26540 [Promethearchaeota archaeon]
MRQIGRIAECRVCGRKVLVEQVLEDTDHTVQLTITCWECLTPAQREKAVRMYDLDLIARLKKELEDKRKKHYD